MSRATAYAHCDCGLLVRLARIPDAEQVAAELAKHGSHAFVGQCPACKAAAQLTITRESKLVKPALVLEGGAS